MSYLSRAEYDFQWGGPAVTIVNRGRERGQMLQFERKSPIEYELNGAYVAPSPSLRLSDEEARAVMDALLDYFGMSRGDVRLRDDYLAERARVDKLTDAVLEKLNGQARAAALRAPQTSRF